ncbi:MAG: hypothetical protein WC875_00915 [Candidatus Absconditabacterales bacterium]|jgi:hypothetical protein
MTKKIKIFGLIIGMMISVQLVFGQKTAPPPSDSVYCFVSWFSQAETFSAENAVVKVPSTLKPMDVWKIIEKTHSVFYFITCIKLGYEYAPIEYDYNPGTTDSSIKWQIDYVIKKSDTTTSQGVGTITTANDALSIPGIEKFIKKTGYGENETVIITNFRKIE